jgi:hypothetical protein
MRFIRDGLRRSIPPQPDWSRAYPIRDNGLASALPHPEPPRFHTASITSTRFDLCPKYPRVHDHLQSRQKPGLPGAVKLDCLLSRGWHWQDSILAFWNTDTKIGTMKN